MLLLVPVLSVRRSLSLPPRSTCCPSFLVNGLHDIACTKNMELFTTAHASICYASHEDCYVFDATIVPFLRANLGTLLKLTTVSQSVLTSHIASAALIVVRITAGIIVGFALVENRDNSGNTFHIMLHASLEGTLLLTCRAWARICGTRAWAKGTSWDTTQHALTTNPKRMFHACMFKRTIQTPKLISEPIKESVDLISCASDLAATFQQEAAATAKRALTFTRHLSLLTAAKAGEKRAREIIDRIEEQLEGAIAAKHRAEAVCVRAEKELRECMKGV